MFRALLPLTLATLVASTPLNAAQNRGPKVQAHPAAAHADGKVADKNGKKSSKRSFIGKSPYPGTVKVHRWATNEDFSIRVGRGRVSSEASKKFGYMMRAQTGTIHHIDPRLMSLLGVVSDHFAGRKIEVISGYRPYTPKQFTKDSRHNHGRAVDFRVTGVPNEVVRDFCRTLKNTGCGYYPNSVFVHMDVRDASAYWIDYSRPGEPPRYHSPSHDADEGTSDVHADHDATDSKDAPKPADAPPAGLAAPGATPATEPAKPN